MMLELEQNFATKKATKPLFLFFYPHEAHFWIFYSDTNQYHCFEISTNKKSVKVKVDTQMASNEKQDVTTAPKNLRNQKSR